ncbi:MAG: hypothetical protein R3272_05370 [Candidatus Promineifilaceae bacterium]|nr:hypothetical protein [Candidatus Promineifilaceae bacterium]
MNEEKVLQTLKAEIADLLLFRRPEEAPEERVASLGREVARRAREDFPVFHQTLNLLGYHNRLTLINKMMILAWDQVQDAASYSSRAVDAYAARATDHLIYRYLEDESGAAGSDAAPPAILVEQLEHFFPVDAERLQPYLLLLRGEAGRPWTAADFGSLSIHNLGGLMIEFLGYAHRVDGVPYARAHLVREQLPRYFLDRAGGHLYPRLDMAARLRGHGPPRPVLPTEPAHPLLPDPLTLEEFISRLVRTVNAQPYAAAATVEMLPTWLDFLRSRHLVPDREAEEAARSLHPLTERLELP